MKPSHRLVKPSHRLDVLDQARGWQHVELVVHHQAVRARGQRQHQTLVEPSSHILRARAGERKNQRRRISDGAGSGEGERSRATEAREGD